MQGTQARARFPLRKGNKRIDKILTSLGLCSRTETGSYLRKNNITLLDGTIIKKNFRVTPDQLLLDGKPFPYSLEPLHIALHKPNGYLCTMEKGEHKTVYDLLPPEYAKRLPKLGICGRLDKWVTGLVILSQDGKLQNKIINPKGKRKVKKVYVIEGRRPFTGEEEGIFKSGTLKLRGEIEACRPAGFEILDKEKQIAKITLREGRYHQVRRMMAAIGNGVPKSITRVQIGKVTLENLPVGHWRLLTPEELEEFRSRRQKNPTAQGNVDSQDRPQRQKRNEGAIDDEEDEEEEDDNEEEEPLWADDEDEEEPKVKPSKPRAKQMYKEGPVLRK